MANSIKDIAAAAGVSVATVSYVINGTRPVAPKTAERVRIVMRELNYIPNQMARNLRSNSTKNIAIIIQNLANGFFNDVIDAIHEYLSPHDYTMFLSITQDSMEEEMRAFRSMITQQVSGIIMAPIRSNFDFKTLCPHENYPLVFIDRTQRATSADSVICNNYDITYDAVSELIRRGHRRIAYLCGVQPAPISTNIDRMNAYANALHDHGILLDESLVFSHDVGAAESYEAMRQVVEQTDATASFIANGGITAPALQCLWDRNISMPDRMATISFDEYNWSALTKVTLSTIKQPTSELGRNAARLILDRIEKPEKAYETVVLQTELILRDSV